MRNDVEKCPHKDIQVTDTEDKNQKWAPWAGRDLARSRLSSLSAAGLAEFFRDDHCLPPMLGSVAGLNTSPSAGNSAAEQRRNKKAFLSWSE